MGFVDWIMDWVRWPAWRIKGFFWQHRRKKPKPPPEQSYGVLSDPTPWNKQISDILEELNQEFSDASCYFWRYSAPFGKCVLVHWFMGDGHYVPDAGRFAVIDIGSPHYKVHKGGYTRMPQLTFIHDKYYVYYRTYMGRENSMCFLNLETMHYAIFPTSGGGHYALKTIAKDKFELVVKSYCIADWEEQAGIIVDLATMTWVPFGEPYPDIPYKPPALNIF